jgi:hypothetical protein
VKQQGLIPLAYMCGIETAESEFGITGWRRHLVASALFVPLFVFTLVVLLWHALVGRR